MSDDSVTPESACAEVVRVPRSWVVRKQDLVFPETLEECYEYVKTNCTRLELVNSLSYWRVGSIVSHMFDTFSVKEPVQAMSRETGLTDRHVRYCRAVYDAFDGDEVQRLCDKGMEWSTIRELASEKVAPFRENLVELFLTDRATDLEIRNYALQLRGGAPLDSVLNADGTPVPPKVSDPGGDDTPERTKQFRTLRSRLLKHAKDVYDGAADFSAKLCSELSDVIFGPDGTEDPEIAEALQESEAEMQKVIVEAVHLVRTTHLMLAKGDYPFTALDSMLANMHSEFMDDEVAPVEDTPPGV